jgi:hypothetical protein
VGAVVFHADRRTDGHEEANVAFRNFAKALKMYFFCYDFIDIRGKEFYLRNSECEDEIFDFTVFCVW